MKKALFLTLFAALLLFSACGAEEPTHEVVSQPPDLVITVPEDSVTKHVGQFNWTFLDENGQESQAGATPGMRADWWNKQPALTTADGVASIDFAQLPDEVDFSRYSVTDGRQTFCELTESGDLILTDGRWTYVCIAQWTDESRPYHGWGKYIVCIEKK